MKGCEEREGHGPLTAENIPIDEIKSLLTEDTVSRRVFNELKKAMNIRKNQPAFHPGSQQEILSAGSSLVAFRRFNGETGDL